jgi:DNA repair protein RadC
MIIKENIEDEVLTERLQKAGEILGIQVLDHVIVGNNSQWSITGGGLSS